MLLLLALTFAARAAPIPTGSELPAARAGLSGGWESAPSLALQGGLALGERLQLDLAAGGPIRGLPGAFEVGAGASGLAFQRGRWGVGAAAGTGLARANDATGEQLAWTGELLARPGLYALERQLSLEVGWRGSLATHIVHSDAVHALYADRYPGSEEEGPEDGWYAGTAGELRAGLSGGLRRGSVGLGARAGFAWTPQEGGLVMNGMLGVIPFYGTVEAAWLW